MKKLVQVFPSLSSGRIIQSGVGRGLQDQTTFQPLYSKVLIYVYWAKACFKFGPRIQALPYFVLFGPKNEKQKENINMWRCGESNPVPLACEASALPYELHPLLF